MADLSFSEGLRLLESRTRLAVIAIWSVIGFGALEALGELLEAAGVIDIDAAVPSALSLAFSLIYVAFFVVFVISVVLVGMWIYRAHANLFAAGLGELEYSPGWSVGWFFVPIANLFKPMQAMRELWNASYGTDNSYGSETPSSISIWWGTYIAGNIVSYASLRLDLGGSGTSAASTAALIGAVGSVLTVISAWFLLQIVREVMEGQRNHLQVSEAFA